MGISTLTSTQAQRVFINYVGMFLLGIMKGNSQADKISLDWLKLTESIIIIKRAHRMEYLTVSTSTEQIVSNIAIHY